MCRMREGKGKGGHKGGLELGAGGRGEWALVGMEGGRGGWRADGGVCHHYAIGEHR